MFGDPGPGTMSARLLESGQAHKNKTLRTMSIRLYWSGQVRKNEILGGLGGGGGVAVYIGP